MTLVIVLSSLTLGIVISRLIMRSIVVPLEAVKHKTRRISEGDFTEDLSISSPPEINDLANIINLMCHKLLQLDKLKADFFHPCHTNCAPRLLLLRRGYVCCKREREGKLPIVKNGF
jgi:hypothetical protein